MLAAALAYVLAAALCWITARAMRPRRRGPAAFFAARTRRRTWLVVAVILAGLGVVRLVDLSNLATTIGRHAVQGEGWYAQRRAWQREAIVAILVAAAVIGAAAAVVARRAGIMAVGAVIATTALLGFVAVRAVSLHQVDALLTSGFGPVTLGRAIEFGLLAVVALAAALARRVAVRDP